MSKLKKTILKVSIHRDGDNPVFSEASTHVSISDQAAGGFIVLEQFGGHTRQEVRLDPDELCAVYSAAKELLENYPETK